MDDAEKSTELKKAYANIILHTAQEATVRIMASERRAVRFQNQASEAKEEALGMLVRLKQMMDSKIEEAEVVSFRHKKKIEEIEGKLQEAEFVSLRQKNKIEELEGQLQEAEDVVRDLREELAVVRDELKTVKKCQSRSLDDEMLKHDLSDCHHIGASRIIKSDASESLLHSCSDEEADPGQSPDCNNPMVGPQNDENKFERQMDAGSMAHFGSIAYLPSILRRSKVRVPYANGCTQMIHTLGRYNKVTENLCSSKELDDAKNESIVEAKLPTLATENNDTISDVEKAQSELGTNGTCLEQSFHANIFHGNGTRHGEPMHIHASSPEHLTQDLRLQEMKSHSSHISDSDESSGSEDNNLKCLNVEDGKAAKLSLPSTTSEIEAQPEYVVAKQNSVNRVKACSFRNRAESHAKEARKVGEVMAHSQINGGPVDLDIVPHNSNVIEYTKKRKSQDVGRVDIDMSISSKIISSNRKTSDEQIGLVSSTMKQTRTGRVYGLHRLPVRSFLRQTRKGGADSDAEERVRSNKQDRQSYQCRMEEN